VDKSGQGGTGLKNHQFFCGRPLRTAPNNAWSDVTQVTAVDRPVQQVTAICVPAT